MTWLSTFLFALVSAITDALDGTVYKKVNEIAYRYGMSKPLLSFLDSVAFLAVFLLPFVFFFSLWETSFQEFLQVFASYKNIALLVGVAVFRQIVVNFWSFAYQNEKMSVLAPYAQSSVLIMIVAGYFLFEGSTDLKTLIIALIAFSVLWFHTRRGGKIVFTKNCTYLLISEVAQAWQMLCAAGLLIEISPLGVLIGQSLFGFVAAFILLLLLRPKFSFPTVRRDVIVITLNDTLSNWFWFFNTFAALFLIQSVWVTLTVLLSMVTLVTSFVTSYFFFGDIPERRDIAVSFVIVVLIGIGLYFSPTIQ